MSEQGNKDIENKFLSLVAGLSGNVTFGSMAGSPRLSFSENGRDLKLTVMRVDVVYTIDEAINEDRALYRLMIDGSGGMASAMLGKVIGYGVSDKLMYKDPIGNDWSEDASFDCSFE